MASLVTFAGTEKKSPFANVLKDTITELRKQINRSLLSVDVEEEPSPEAPIPKHTGWLWEAWTESELKRRAFATASDPSTHTDEKKFSFWPNFNPAPTDMASSAATRSFTSLMPNGPWTPCGNAGGGAGGLFGSPNVIGLPGQR